MALAIKSLMEELNLGPTQPEWQSCWVASSSFARNTCVKLQVAPKPSKHWKFSFTLYNVGTMLQLTL